MPRPGYPTSVPMIQRAPSSLVARPGVPATSTTNTTTPPSIRVPSGLSVSKATVMTGIYLIT